MKNEQSLSPLQQQLRAARLERQAAGRDPALHAARQALKTFQAARLARTHADLLAAPDTRQAAEFFLEELYSAHDLSQRDTDLERIAPTMQRVLPADALQTITEAMQLDALAERLDTAMAQLLGSRFSEADYIQAYRRALTPDERARQLALVQALGDSLSQLVRVPMLSGTLALMRGPARLAGLGGLQQFLERGFSAFKRMNKPRDFVAAVTGRERLIMQRLYEGHPAPFDIS